MPLAGLFGFNDFFELSFGIEYSDFFKHGPLLSPAGDKILSTEEGVVISTTETITPDILNLQNRNCEQPLNIFSSMPSHPLSSNRGATA